LAADDVVHVPVKLVPLCPLSMTISAANPRVTPSSATETKAVAISTAGTITRCTLRSKHFARRMALPDRVQVGAVAIGRRSAIGTGCRASEVSWQSADQTMAASFPGTFRGGDRDAAQLAVQ
jgi:hypothetical protein